MNKNYSARLYYFLDPLRRLIEIVRQGETLEIHGLDPEELHVMGLVEGLLGIDHAPALQIALGRVQNRCHSEITEYSEINLRYSPN